MAVEVGLLEAGVGYPRRRGWLLARHSRSEAQLVMKPRAQVERELAEYLDRRPTEYVRWCSAHMQRARARAPDPDEAVGWWDDQYAAALARRGVPLPPPWSVEHGPR
jgi:hypothetical protein